MFRKVLALRDFSQIKARCHATGFFVVTGPKTSAVARPEQRRNASPFHGITPDQQISFDELSDDPSQQAVSPAELRTTYRTMI